MPEKSARSIQFRRNFATYSFVAPFQPDDVEAQMHQVYSATIGLLSESHGTVPHHLAKVSQTTISKTPKVVSERTTTYSARPAPLSSANRFHPTYAKDSRYTLLSVLHQHFAPAIYITRFISPSHRSPLPYLLLPIALNIFIFDLCANSRPHSPNLATAKPRPPQPR